MKQTALKLALVIGLALMLMISTQAQSKENLLQKTKRAEILNNQAIELFEAGKFAEAAEFLRQAVQLRPDYKVAY